MIDSTGWLSIFGSMSRRNSRTDGGAEGSAEADAEAARPQPDEPARQVQDRADDRADGRSEDPEAGEHERAEDDPGVVEERRKPVPEEALLGEEHLAQCQ